MSNNKYFYLPLVLMVSPLTSAVANQTNVSLSLNNEIQQKAQDQQQDSAYQYGLQKEQQNLKTNIISQQKNNAKQTKADDEMVRFTGKQLRENPEILERLFLDALTQMNIKILPVYIALYKQVPNRDESLIEWGNALIATDKDLSKASKEYQKLLKNFPNNDYIKFQYASVLFSNQHLGDARKLFKELLQSTRTEQDGAVYQQYLNSIEQREKWDFSVNGNFLRDKNLAQSAKPGTVWNLPNGGTFTTNTPTQSGTGLALSFNSNKYWYLSTGRYLSFNGGLSGKYYWDNKKYNDLNLNLGLGYGYQSARATVELQPYFAKRLYAGGLSDYGRLKSYTNTLGTVLSFNYWLAPKWKYSAYYNYGYTKYNHENNKRNEGASHFISNGLTYFANDKQYWYGAIDLGLRNAKDDTESYTRKGLRLAWGQQWPAQFVTNTSVGYSEVKRKEALFFDIKQKDKNYSSSLSLWNRVVSYKGFVPKVTFSYTKVDSNYPINSYTGKDVFIEVGKSF